MRARARRGETTEHFIFFPCHQKRPSCARSSLVPLRFPSGISSGSGYRLPESLVVSSERAFSDGLDPGADKLRYHRAQPRGIVKLPYHATLALSPRPSEHQRHIGTITLPTHVPPRLRIVLPEPAEGAKLQRQLWPVLCTHLLRSAPFSCKGKESQVLTSGLRSTPPQPLRRDVQVAPRHQVARRGGFAFLLDIALKRAGLPGG